MLIQSRAHRYHVQKKRGITHEDFTRRYALADLEDKLNRELETPAARRRQREKVFRLESRMDRLRLELNG